MQGNRSKTTSKYEINEGKKVRRPVDEETQKGTKKAKKCKERTEDRNRTARKIEIRDNRQKLEREDHSQDRKKLSRRDI